MSASTITHATRSSKKAVTRILSAGAGRGARLLVPSIRRVNEASTRLAIRPTYVDASPGKATALTAEAVREGVPAEALEARIEDVLAAGLDGCSTSPVILNLDRPSAIAVALRAAGARTQAVLGYLLVVTPSRELLGIRIVLAATEGDHALGVARFFDALAAVTARSGASWIVGERGEPAHRAIEPVYRDWFAEHFAKNFGKLVGGLEPESSPIEITRDGRRSLAAVITESENGWREPAVLAEEVAANPPLPLLRGEDFAILECGTDGVRIHIVRLRVTDGRLAVFGTTAIDPKAIVEEQRQEIARVTAEAIARHAERALISRRSPALTTD